MASYIGSDEELLCPICASFYNTPRKLPRCGHSFCEKCIVTLLQNLKSDEKLGEKFECPVCRLPSKSPENDTTDISKWVQELDIDKELQSKVGKQNEQDTKWCSQCRYVEKFIKSEVYCSTCQESYCGKCSEMLHSFKMNRDHAIIDIKVDGENEILNEQAVQLLKTFITCSIHPDKSVEFICKEDESVCCATCVTNKHQGCKDILSITDLKQNNNGDEDDDEYNPAHLLGSFSKLNDHIRSVINLIKEKDAEAKKVPQKLGSEFQEIKQKMIRLLDTVEERIKQDGKALTKAISVESLDEIELLNSIGSEISVVTYLLGTLVPKLPKDSVLMCCKNAKVMLKGLERKVLERGSSFKTEELQLELEEEFDTIINLGPNETENIISVKKNPKHHPLPRYNDKFLLREGRAEVVGEKNDCISGISPGAKPRYNSVTFLPDNSLVLTDSYYGICLLLDADSQVADSINFGVNVVTEKSYINGNQIYSAYMTNGLIAVSILYANKICFFSHNKNKLEQTGELFCKYMPSVIHALGNGDLCVLWENPRAFGIISLCGCSYQEKVYFETDNDGKLIRHTRQMAVDEDRHHVICPFSQRDMQGITVLACYDFSGNQVFENIYPEIQDPRGIALDADGNFYICDLILGGVHVLSPEGLHIKVIQEGCPERPLCIGFHKSKNMFAVTQANPNYQQVVLFSIGPP